MIVNNKEIKLYTSFQADYLYGGGAILRYILPHISRICNIEWKYIERKKAEKSLFPQILNIKIKGFPFLSYYPLINRFQSVYDRMWVLVWVLIESLILKKNDKIWLILENDMIDFGYFLLKIKKNLVVHLSIHDDCLYNYPSLQRNNEDKLRYIFSKATSIDVIGFNLKEKYLKLFGISSIIFRRGVKFHNYHKISSRSNNLKLVFVGSSHSDISWEKLLTFLEKLINYRFELNIYNDQDPFQKRGFKKLDNLIIIHKGIVDEEIIINDSKDYDLAVFFWNDFFKNRLRYSVSTKVTTYLSCGIPMLASIHPDSEHYNLFKYGLAFNIENGSEDDFKNWYENALFLINFRFYIDNFFNHQKMIESFLLQNIFNDR